MMTAPSPDGGGSGKPKKTVSFVEGHDAVLVEQIEELDVATIWFTPDDYFEIKAQTRMDAKEWRKRGYGILLNETFENPIPEAQEYLNAFCRLEEKLTRRGLERHLSRRHGEERSDLKDRARYCVLSHQRSLKREGIKFDEMEEQLSKIYQDICRCAKVFARRMGKADELVVTEGESNEPADAIVDEHDEDAAGGGQRMERRLSNYSAKSGDTVDTIRLAQVHSSPPLSTRLVHHHPNGKSSQSPGGTSSSSPETAGNPKPCPASPASPSDELYAAIA